MKHSWRFIDTGINNGFINMAIDEAILEHYIQNGGPPTIRVYGWDPPALSLGASQSIEEINVEQCRFSGIDIVRRPTGGKAVLHDAELTYSVVASSKDGFPNNISGAYNMIAQSLIEAYHILGVEVQIKRKRKSRRINQVCFLTATLADLVYNGRKIIGSAQMRKGDAFLQHGSLVISRAPELLFSLFNYPSDEVRKKEMAFFTNTTASLNSILGREIDYEEIKEALWQGFQKAWEIDLYKAELTNEEIKLEHRILETKYLKSDWNYNNMKSSFRKRISPNNQNLVDEVTSLISKFNLNTVCQSALCPNFFECFARGTATFMIMGDVCTRDCRFCAVKTGKPKPLDPDEPYRVAQAAKELALSYVVITSVTRDDLPYGGASHFASTIEAAHAILPEAGVEVLVPDFKGSQEAIKEVIRAKPDVFNHNVETVPRLYRLVRPEANYKRSLEVLKIAKDMDDSVITKSGLMVGLGEEQEEILKVMEYLANVGCDLLTIGQYLSPSKRHIPVHKFWEQEEFDKLANIGRRMGFKEVISGFFVRSSYRAKDMLRFGQESEEDTVKSNFSELV